MSHLRAGSSWPESHAGIAHSATWAAVSQSDQSQHNSMWRSCFPPPAGHDGGCTSVLTPTSCPLSLKVARGAEEERAAVKYHVSEGNLRSYTLVARPALKIIGRHGFNSHNNFCAGASSMKRPLLRCDSSLQTPPLPNSSNP